MALTKRLYANNAKTTLAVAISSPATTAITVTDGSSFPNPNPSIGEYFLLTLESGPSIEVVRVTERSGSNFTIVRGQEGTTAATFPVGTKADNRATKETFESFARYVDRVVPLSNFAQLSSPGTSDSKTYIVEEDDGGTRILLAADDTNSLWTFSTHNSVVATVTSTGSTQPGFTGITPSLPASVEASPVSGKYLIQVTTGTHAGSVRILAGWSGGVISWNDAFGTPIPNGSTIVIYQSTYSILQDLRSRVDTGLIYAIIFGE